MFAHVTQALPCKLSQQLALLHLGVCMQVYRGVCTVSRQKQRAGPKTVTASVVSEQSASRSRGHVLGLSLPTWCLHSQHEEAEGRT